MRYAVVIPAYNASETIAATLCSALRHDAISELVVVDDGSTDGTAGIVTELASELGNGRVRVVQQSNAGAGAARNLGAAAARSERLVFLDADDEFAEAAFDIFEQAPHDALLVRTGGIVVHPDGSGVRMLAVADPHPNPRGAPFAGSFAIDRELFADLGGYDVRFGYGENSELLLRAHLALEERGVETHFVGEPTVVYRQREGRNDAYASRKRDGVELMMRKHRAAFARDPDYLARHLAIASHLHRSAGARRPALAAAVRLARLRPRSAQSWGAVALSIWAPSPDGAGRLVRRFVPSSVGQDATSPASPGHDRPAMSDLSREPGTPAG